MCENPFNPLAGQLVFWDKNFRMATVISRKYDHIELDENFNLGIVVGDAQETILGLWIPILCEGKFMKISQAVLLDFGEYFSS
jgi:hypothetical protein